MNDDQSANSNGNQGGSEEFGPVEHGMAENAPQEVDPAYQSVGEMEVNVTDPSGAAEPVSAAKGAMNLGAAASIVIVAGGATLHFIAGQVGSCAGATRSATLQWQQRQAEIRAAMDDSMKRELGIPIESEDGQVDDAS